MPVTFDPEKSQRNVLARGLPFVWVDDFDWSTAWIVEDTRKEYGERRFQALGSRHAAQAES